MVAGVPTPFSTRLLLLSLLGLAVRLLWVAFEPATSPVADETMWLTWGTKVLPSSEVGFSPLRLRFVFHPPVYLYFVGASFAVTGSLAALQYLQCLVGALLVPALGLLGRSAASESAGLVAAGLAAFYPELVWFAAHFWAETLFTVLLWWAIERLVASDAGGSSAAAAGAGVLFGLAVLTRETVLYFLPLAALWLAWRRPGGARRAALVVGGWALRGISSTVVTPPAAAPLVPASQPSQSARPGSLKCVCASTTPGSTTSPWASITSAAGWTSPPMALIVPPITAMSAGFCPVGRMTMPPRMTRSGAVIPRLKPGLGNHCP